METTTYNTLDYLEFDRLVNEHLHPKDEYECVPENEWHNDSSYTVSVTEADYTPEDRQDVATYLGGDAAAREVYIMPYQLLGELALRGHIPWGEYLITVCW